MVKRALFAIAVAGCGTFEDPNVVIDMRVLAMRASVPEQVVDVDPTQPLNAGAVLAQLVPSDVCVLIADGHFERRLRWSMTMCNLSGAERCPHDGRPIVELGSGIWEDPDDAPGEPPMCATVAADGDLLGVVLDVLQSDSLHGLGGVDYGVSLRVGGEADDPALDLYAAKSLRVTPRIPASVTANHNPFVDHVDALLEDASAAVAVPLGRCVDQPAPLEILPDHKVRLTPVEPDGVREVYTVPTIDGMTRTFTEALTYQWIGAGGAFSDGQTGGPHDPFGNPAPLFTDWKAPAATDLAGPTDFPIWIVQRDERLGVHWYETCIRVVP
jgi:hypothetical protein